MSATTAAAIIAGGQARRFGGRDKSRLLIEGQPIINRQLAILQQVAAHIFIVSSEAARFADLGLPVHADLVSGAGPLSGIYTALAVAPADRVIVVAGDLPFLHAGLLARLAELSAGHDGAWVRTARGPEPLIACYACTARDTIRREIDAGRLAASGLDSVLDLAVIDQEALEQFGSVERLLCNVNTPEEYERVRG